MVNPYINRYRNAEYLQYMKDILELVNLQGVYTIINYSKKCFVNVGNKNRRSIPTSTITQEIIALDDHRDKAFIGIKTLATNEKYTVLLSELDVLTKQYNLVVDNRTNTNGGINVDTDISSIINEEE